MFYIVRAWDAGRIIEYEYDTLEGAQAHMNLETRHAELYVWLGGREEFFSSVN